MKKIELKFDKKRILGFSLSIGLTLLLVVLDQISKLIAENKLKGEPSVPLIDGVLQFTYVENRGAAFGMMANSRWIFMVFSSLAIIAMAAYLFYAAFINAQSRLYTLSVSAILAGGIGNMIDRIALGYVVDFIDFCLIDFAVFNIADSCVCVGAGFLILALILDIIKESKKKKQSDGTDE